MIVCQDRSNRLIYRLKILIQLMRNEFVFFCLLLLFLRGSFFHFSCQVRFGLMQRIGNSRLLV